MSTAGLSSRRQSQSTQLVSGGGKFTGGAGKRYAGLQAPGKTTCVRAEIVPRNLVIILGFEILVFLLASREKRSFFVLVNLPGTQSSA